MARARGGTRRFGQRGTERQVQSRQRLIEDDLAGRTIERDVRSEHDEADGVELMLAPQRRFDATLQHGVASAHGANSAVFDLETDGAALREAARGIGLEA